MDQGKKSLRPRILADLGLMATALIWGANFVVVKNTLDQVPPMLFLGLRFGIAFLVVAPFGFGSGRRPGHWKGWGKAALTGLLLFGGFATQTLGLQYTTPGMSGFITGIYVVLVPLFSIAATRRFPGWRVIAAALAVVSGLGFLFLRGRTGFGAGEWLTLACAVFFALHFLALGRWAKDLDPVFLTAIQLLVTGAASFVAVGFSGAPTMSISGWAWWAILYAALPASVGAYFIQTSAQRYAPANHAAIILSLESLFAVVFSVIWGLDQLTVAKLVGFSLIMGGIFLAEWNWTSSIGSSG